MFKYLFLLSISLLVVIAACNSSGKKTSTANGEAIYKKYCVTCHGIDGKLGLNGSKDLSVSAVPEAERIIQITKGKNTMTPFEGILTPEEIKAVAAYSMTLTKQ